ncbi:MAG: HAMP domain-containing protein [Alphaproteobacteria bacterium]|jgi:methyl-accepting chemotaxis protein|nr:HAMP domain-containing protein [Alphaproteobacteria bacterium]MBT4017140.1 HAMP domain-containing protein [Alphaproteobacteria bacterium]MBT4966226.1 HAMP domain-containing protein [Alphaproteobacteria bacterium]MBT5159699.1 HAMP domain-containing protein [Alphaproteobacteria bacterium]MBT5918334.1 HAMP domain-containing protein [Alphaproteobacteria bacterium]
MSSSLRFGITARIFSLVALALAGILAVSIFLIVERRNAANEMEVLNELGQFAPVVSAVVHELQKERGMSAGFIGSKGSNFKDTLPGQRSDSDARRTALLKAIQELPIENYGADIGESLEVAGKALAGLDQTRSAVSSLGLTVPQMAKYYTGTIGKLLKIVEGMTHYSQNADVSRAISAYTAYLQGKERAGIERAMGAGGFGAKKFNPAVYRKFLQLIAMQNTYLDRFMLQAEPETIALHKATIKGPTIEEVNRLRKIAIESPVTGTTGNIAAPVWFKAITKKIDLLKKVEDGVAGYMTSLTNQVLNQKRTEYYMFLIGALVLVLVVGGFATAIAFGISRPVNYLTGTMESLAGGKLDVDIQFVDRADEIGGMARAIEVFKEQAIAKIQLEQEETKSSQERRDREKADREQEEAARVKEQAHVARIEDLTTGFEMSVDEVLGIVSSSTTQVESSARSMNNIASSTMEHSITVASAAEQATASVQTVAAAAEELTASIGEISRQVHQSTSVAQSAVEAADNTNVTIRNLADSAQKVGDVVNLINDIASQTGLLALNATIEAARAGEAGKGFAVVASEVKDLASQTAKATDEIAMQVSSIQNATDEAVEAIGNITSTIGEMSEIATAIASAVEEQGAATNEISRNVLEAASGTEEVSASIIDVKNGSEETGAASTEVLSASVELNERFATLQSDVAKFLTDIKAA